MELRFGEKEEKLREEVRSFLIANNGRGEDSRGNQLGSRSDEEFEFAKGFNRKLAERGWIAPAWPKEYGGLGASIYEQMVFNEEFGYWGAPDTGTRGFGVGMIGPTLIIHGSEEQKKYYLPKITSGEHIWCQGYSEPGAGFRPRGTQTAPFATVTTTSSTVRRLDSWRPPRQPDVLPGPHRPRGPQAPRHQLHADR